MSKVELPNAWEGLQEVENIQEVPTDSWTGNYGSPKVSRKLLLEADELINGQRQQDYGDKLQNFAQIAMLWEGTLAHKLAPGQHISAEDVALCMIQVKIARLAKSPDHRDSILDVAGYAGCYDKLQEERQNGSQLLGVTNDSRKDNSNPSKPLDT